MTAAQRKHIKAVLDWHWAHRSAWDYPPGDQRSSRDNYSWHLSEGQMERYVLEGHRPQMDCSEFCSWVLKCVGAWPFGSPGYTGSHLASMPVYWDPKDALLGALVVFGPGTGHHEAMVLKPDPKYGNPILHSHGRPGMDRPTLHEMTASQTAAGHPGVRFLSILHL